MSDSGLLEMPRLALQDRGRNIIATIILPAHNEAHALPKVLSELNSLLNEHYEIIVVDDGSTDETARLAQKHLCRLIRHTSRRGKGSAIRTGIRHANGQYLVIMDADATYPAREIPRIVKLLTENDLVRCSRQAGNETMPLINRLGNWLFDRLLTGVHGLDGKDHLSGLYGMRREVALGLDLQSEGFDIEAEIGIKARAKQLRVTTFPVIYQSRLGEKKLRPWRDGFTILSRIVVLVLLYNPMVTFVFPGVVLMLLALSGAFVLERGPVITPYFGLSIHSFIVAALGVLAAFQLIVFGMAAALYGVEAGYRPPRWLIVANSRPIRLGGALLGFGMAFGASLDILRLIMTWISSGAGLFLETQAIVLASTVTVLGLQILSAALFLSIFSGRLQRQNHSLLPENPQADDSA